jgi:hypothetical protein
MQFNMGYLMNKTSTVEDPSHFMTYAEREKLKAFAYDGKGLSSMLVVIAHWMRVSTDISFSDYVANWAEANRGQGKEVEAIREKWPHSGEKFIADNGSEWGSVKQKA